jgi:hypothetical protein
MKNSNIINGNCWLAYFDFLGFKNRVREFSGRLDILKNQYEDIIKKVKESNALQPDKVSVQWFSDSILFFCSDDSRASFACIDLEIRHFFSWALWMKWPLSGALTHGELYVDKAENIYLGQAIVDAHKYTEKQNWLGLVITPMARIRLEDIVPKFARTNDVYANYDVPIKPEEERKDINETIEKLLAFRFGHFPSTSKKLEMILKRMSKDQNPMIKKKYDNTTKFIEGTKPDDTE